MRKSAGSAMWIPAIWPKPPQNTRMRSLVRITARLLKNNEARWPWHASHWEWKKCQPPSVRRLKLLEQGRSEPGLRWIRSCEEGAVLFFCASYWQHDKRVVAPYHCANRAIDLLCGLRSRSTAMSAPIPARNMSDCVSQPSPWVPRNDSAASAESRAAAHSMSS